jgi:hypothetical protein
LGDAEMEKPDSDVGEGRSSAGNSVGIGGEMLALSDLFELRDRRLLVENLRSMLCNTLSLPSESFLSTPADRTMLLRLSTAPKLFRLSAIMLMRDDLLVKDLTMPFGFSSLIVAAAVAAASFSALSISPATVLPFVASFSSSSPANLTMPLSLGTCSTSATKHWIKYAFLLFVTGCTSLGIAVMSKI